MSPRVIREALDDRQCSVLHDPENGRRYVIPSRPSAEAKDIYATHELTAGGTEAESAWA